MVALLQSEFPAILEFEWGNFQHAILHLLQAESCVHIGGLNSPASQPTASVFKGSTGKETSSVRWQVLHSKVRRSNPRSPGEIRPKPILCLQVGHIGRSTVENELRISRHPRARICIAETRGLSGVRHSVKFNLAAAPHTANGSGAGGTFALVRRCADHLLHVARSKSFMALSIARSASKTAWARLCAIPVRVLVASNNTIHFQPVGLAVWRMEYS